MSKYNTVIVKQTNLSGHSYTKKNSVSIKLKECKILSDRRLPLLSKKILWYELIIIQRYIAPRYLSKLVSLETNL